MSEILRIKTRQVSLIIVSWMLLGVLIAICDYLDLHSDFSLGPSKDYTFLKDLLINVGAAFTGGLFGGIFLVFYVKEKFRDRPYGYSILAVALAFVFIVGFIIIMLSIVIGLIETGKSISHPETKEVIKNYMTNPFHLKNIIVWSLIVAMTQLLLQVNDKFGPGILWSFIKGKYHSPKEETRIFMFLDLKSSTTIAEKIGNRKYYSLLRDFYGDITNAIIYNKGEIYQYVGDEVVLSWKLDKGVEKNHCIKCYFDMRETIEEKKEKYLDKYGFIPEFKAGLHYGTVTAGEVGVIKKDITYSGDVLNTTARIQSKCNEYNVKILVSNVLLKLLALGEDYKKMALGDITLRGKKQKIELSTLDFRNTLQPAVA